ncbi:MAG: acetoacetate--CoA ligase [Litorivicinaceae bacterium]
MQPLWTPTRDHIAQTQVVDLMAMLNQQTGRALGEYAALHRFSVHEPEQFWPAVWAHAGILGDPGERVLSTRTLPGAQFFPDGTLNLAENCLMRGEPKALALRVYTERGHVASLTRQELIMRVATVQEALSAAGISAGDVVAGFLPNGAEAIIGALATLSLGAIWTSCSPDFGIDAVIDRFGQTQPKALLAVSEVLYGGVVRDVSATTTALLAGIPSLEVCLHVGTPPSDVSSDARVKRLDQLPVATQTPRFLRVNAQHPAFILYSSGTTGAPKCIIHSHVGALLQVVKEHRYHVDIKPGDRLFYYTTCGWMMWNWLCLGLASEAALMLYDGSPFAQGPETLWSLAAADQWTVFGTSAKYLSALDKAGYRPATEDLSALKAVLSTGSPLAPTTFEFVYRDIKADVLLGSISGGTDILSCFCLCSPLLPVYSGQLQCAGLGLDVDVVDPDGRSVTGTQGELVCRRPFPSLPVGFYHDPDNQKYHAAYFEKFPGLWTHGDYAERTLEGGFIIHGRSDTTLNPGGVRIGTAELYRALDDLESIRDAVAIGVRRDEDEDIVLFVVLPEGESLTEALAEDLRARIRAARSPRHVPKIIAQVADVPRTVSGKIAELAVRQIVHGEPIGNMDALANPDALEYFRNHPALAS